MPRAKGGLTNDSAFAYSVAGSLARARQEARADMASAGGWGREQVAAGTPATASPILAWAHGRVVFLLASLGQQRLGRVERTHQ